MSKGYFTKHKNRRGRQLGRVLATGHVHFNAHGQVHHIMLNQRHPPAAFQNACSRWLASDDLSLILGQI